MTEQNKVKIVAEIGCNHQGSMDMAKRLIEEAAKSGADYAKFQKRTIPDKEDTAPHPDPANAHGDTYHAHRKALEFSLEQHRELKAHCEEAGIGYACSVWDMGALEDIASLGPDYIKIPSAKNEDEELINLATVKMGSQARVHISLGMLTEERRNEIMFEFYDCIPYLCTSCYPCPMDDVYLEELKDFVPPVGFSGHHLGIAIDMAAVALGIDWLERHFTLDRTMKGTDHAASLEPGGLARMVRDVRAVEAALKNRPDGIPECEMPAWRKFKGGK